MGDRNQEPCLEEVIQFVESKESGKRSAIRLLDSHAVGTISRYHSSKKDEIKASNSTQLARRAAPINRPNSDPHEPCHYCSKGGHGKRALPQVRAYGHECKHCHKRHHFESVCRGKSDGGEDSKDNTEAVFQSLCAVTEHFSPLYSVIILDQNPGRRAIALDHHVYDQLSKMWLRRSSEPQPYVMLTVTPVGEDYTDLGWVPSKVEDEVEHPAVDGRHGVPELPRWNETPPAFWHDCRRLDTRFYEDARCQWQGNQYHWCCHPSILTQVTVWGAAGNEADHIHHRHLCQTVPESLGMITVRFPTVGAVISP